MSENLAALNNNKTLRKQFTIDRQNGHEIDIKEIFSCSPAGLA